MLRRGFVILAAGTVLAGAAVIAEAANVSSASAAPATAAVRVLYYDASRAAEFAVAVDQGATNWNRAVTNVHLLPARPGEPVHITVHVDDGWPRALPGKLGNGRFYLGRSAVRDGHDPVRIAAHEFGHLLGLPDRRTGRCADLMSGSSAGTSCRDAVPNASEASEVDAKFTTAGPAAAAA